MKHINTFNTQIEITYLKAIKLFSEYRGSVSSLLKISANEKKAKVIRRKWLKEGVTVPPLVIVSTTNECNLRCKECYAESSCRDKAPEMKSERIKRLVDEISEAGCSTILLAGGEPLLAKDWMNTVATHNELLGLVFTNGTLMDEKWIDFFDSYRNMIPLFSIEGVSERTDWRRGFGVTKKIESIMVEMNRRRIPFGISITTGSHNYDEVINKDFVNRYIELGCRLIIHVEYVPVGESEEYSPLSMKQKMDLSLHCVNMSSESKAVFITFPGNEDKYGGCLAAGRGFLHIAASGVLEPCPFAPYSDRDLTELTFIEALKSPLLKVLRENADALHEGVGGCSLRNKEEWIRNLQASAGK